MNILERIPTIEELQKNEQFNCVSYKNFTAGTSKQETPRLIVPDKMKETLVNLKSDMPEVKQSEMPRPVKTIGKESQRKGKGRGCM